MLWLGAISCLVWLGLLIFRGGFWRMRAAVLPEANGHAIDVVAVIPARNEAELIGRCTAALMPQCARIYVVDDHSTDGTAAAAHPALVVTARAVPPGWTGKLWALAEGLERALADHARYVLLTDADIEHAPGSIAGLVEQAEAGGYDLVSLMVRLHCETVVERALIPAFVFFFLKLYPPAWIANPRRRTAGAAGGCILIRADALCRIGGIAAIRGELIDDCALAAAVKRAGGRVWLGLAGETRSIRGYHGAAGIWKMIARTAFTQLHHSAALLIVTAAAMFVIYLAPPLVAIAGNRAARACGLMAWGLMSLAYLPALRYYGLSPLWAPLLPAMAAFYVGATVDSAVRYWRGAGGEWKGRVQDRRRAQRWAGD